MSEPEGFLVDVHVAELFFRICSRYGVQNREDRVVLMRELIKRKKAKYLRDVSPLFAGKKVLKIGFKTKGDK